MATSEKHVIIFGAGASVTSGYPMADRLRLLMSSEVALREEIASLGAGYDKGEISGILETVRSPEIQNALRVFRSGGFATVDEFSKLAYRTYPKEVQLMKRLLRFVLSLRDPEANFHRSDYYPFIQRLFVNNLFPLRTDVAILTFNYDPYLAYLLSNAYRTRAEAAGVKQVEGLDALTSGFAFRNVGALEASDELCLLHLHGIVAWPVVRQGENAIWFHDLFGTEARARIDRLVFSQGRDTNPPVIFPWEVFGQEGGFATAEEFCLREAVDDTGWRQGGYCGNNSVHQIFTSTWKRAQKELGRATKISFVGLSMHEFLMPAFEFLFRGRKDDVRLVCASKEHEKFRGPGEMPAMEAHLNSRSPTFKLRRFLKKQCPFVTGRPGHRERPTWSDGGATVSVRETFQDFIENEL
jgi:hypothetical protein